MSLHQSSSAAKAIGDEPVQARVWALRVWSILKASVIRRAAEMPPNRYSLRHTPRELPSTLSANPYCCGLLGARLCSSSSSTACKRQASGKSEPSGGEGSIAAPLYRPPPRATAAR